MNFSFKRFLHRYFLLSSLVSVFFSFVFMPLANALGSENLSIDNQVVINNRKLVSARQLLIEGTDCLHNNQNQEAKAKLMDACAIDPDLPQAHHQLGIALAKLGENDEAINEFSKSIQLDPTMVASWLNLAAIYQTSGKLDQAKQTYQEFILRFPQDKDVSKIKVLITILEKDILDTNKVENEVSGDQSINAGDYLAEIEKRGIWLWPKDRLPLRVYIEATNTINGASSRYITILKEAFSDWANASQGAIRVDFVNSQNNADIICKWSKDISKFKNSNEAANTRIYGNKSGLDKGEIEILTISPDNGKPITENQARATCLHEIGHILGLTGHSSQPEDIMYISSSLKDSWSKLSNRDANTILRLYSNRQ